MHVMAEVASFAVQRDRRESSETCIATREWPFAAWLAQSKLSLTDTPDNNVQVITSSSRPQQTDKHTLSNRFEAMMIWCLVLLCGFYGRHRATSLCFEVRGTTRIGGTKRGSIHFWGIQFPPFPERLSVYNLQKERASEERRREEITYLMYLMV